MAVYEVILISVVNLVLNVGYLDVEDLGEDLAENLANSSCLSIYGILSSVVFNNDKHLGDVVVGIIQVEQIERVNGQCGHGVEATRE